MAKLFQEINIESLTIEECNGNLQQLSSEWSSQKKIFKNRMIGKSAGYTAEAALGEDGVGMVMDQISENVTTMIDNSVEFFKNLGISFEDADKEAARKIQGE